jgi:hypothetical protein
MLVWMDFFFLARTRARFYHIQDFQICNEGVASKYDFSGSNLALEHRISVITPFGIMFILSNIFMFFSQLWKSQRWQRRRAKRRNGYGKVRWPHNHELSAITEIQHLDSFSSQPSRQIFLCDILPKFQRGKPNTGTINAKIRHNVLLPK